jgi:hypothetical protein
MKELEQGMEEVGKGKKLFATAGLLSLLLSIFPRSGGCILEKFSLLCVLSINLSSLRWIASWGAIDRNNCWRG